MLWNWWIVLILMVIFAGAGAAAGLLRTPTYTATTRLAVGRIDITSPGALSGYAAATQALATGYSRTITAQAVAKSVSAETGISVKEVQNHVTATPIAESPAFRVEATSPNTQQAVALANDSSHALIRYAALLNQSNPDSTRLYAQYRRAIVNRKLAKQQLSVAKANGRALPIQSAEAEVEAATLRVNAIGQAYTASIQSQASTRLIQIISPAVEATSDRRSMFIIFTFIGLVAGLLVGGIVAFVRESRLSTKSLTLN